MNGFSANKCYASIMMIKWRPAFGHDWSRTQPSYMWLIPIV